LSLIASFIGALMWMLVIQLLAFIASFPLGWGTAYVIGFAITFVIVSINRILIVTARDY